MSKVVLDIAVVEDLKEWSKSEAPLVKKTFELIADIIKNPFAELGKPEPLKHQYKGYWSRRISGEHRLIYQVSADKTINIISVHGHYE